MRCSDQGRASIAIRCHVQISTLSREEVEAMLRQGLEKTRVYQEARAEGQRDKEAEILRTAVPRLLQTGMSVEQIAQLFNVGIATIRQAAQ